MLQNLGHFVASPKSTGAAAVFFWRSLVLIRPLIHGKARISYPFRAKRGNLYEAWLKPKTRNVSCETSRPKSGREKFFLPKVTMVTLAQAFVTYIQDTEKEKKRGSAPISALGDDLARRDTMFQQFLANVLPDGLALLVGFLLSLPFLLLIGAPIATMI
jgi:hypothetical protein